jgi:hypothetical protein
LEETPSDERLAIGPVGLLVNFKKNKIIHLFLHSKNIFKKI